jgi:DNA-directed RNA polymerase subunit alpha
VRIAGAKHEFTSLPGVVEDVTDIVLNIKNLVVKSHADEPKRLHVRSEVKGPLTASMIDADPAIEIINGDLVLATLADGAVLDMELVVEKGRGFLPSEEMVDEDVDQELGRIYIDASFSPVTRVRYRTEDTRVGQRTNYDRLVLEVWTDGTITPEMAMVEAAKILRKHLNPFVQYFELGEQVVDSGTEDLAHEVDEELQRKLNMSIHELDLTVRASNCMEAAAIETVGELASMTESQLLEIRSFGKTSLREIKRKLSDLGLSLGMSLPLPSREGNEPSL